MFVHVGRTALFLCFFVWYGVHEPSERSLKMDKAITVSNLTKAYKDHLAVDGISFEAGRGEFFSLLGVIQIFPHPRFLRALARKYKCSFHFFPFCF